jgi:hypothetical protein
LAPINRFLVDFGFTVPEVIHKGEIGETSEDIDWGIKKVKFKAAKIALVVQEETARVIRKNSVLAKKRITSAGNIGSADYIPKANAVVFFWYIDEPEACDPEEPVQGFEVIPLFKGTEL